MGAQGSRLLAGQPSWAPRPSPPNANPALINTTDTTAATEQPPLAYFTDLPPSLVREYFRSVLDSLPAVNPNVNATATGVSTSASAAAAFRETDNHGERVVYLRWRHYFAFFADLTERVALEQLKQARDGWHCATLGYAMEPMAIVHDLATEAVAVDPDALDDAYTEDEPSDADDDDDDDDTANQGGRGSGRGGSSRSRANAPEDIEDSDRTDADAAAGGAIAKSTLSSNWNPHLTNPIFFGFSPMKIQEKEQQIASDQTQQREAERRAIDNAKAVLAGSVDAFQKASANQARVRLHRMEEYVKKYQGSIQKKKDEFEKRLAVVSEEDALVFRVQWDNELAASKATFEAELSSMNKLHKNKLEADALALQRKREELEAFKDAEAQEGPVAQRLDDVARVEIDRWLRELTARNRDLDSSMHDYLEVKDELGRKQAQLAQEGNKASAALKKSISELQSMQNIAETKVRENQKLVHQAIDSLRDAQVLLKRASRVAEQQVKLFPLFRALEAKPLTPHSSSPVACYCNLEWFACAVAIAMPSSFRDKVDFLLAIFKETIGERSELLGQYDPFYSQSLLRSLITALHNVLFRLRIVELPPDAEAIDHLLFRSLLDLGHNPIKTPDVSLTFYEVKLLLERFGYHWDILVKLLNLPPTPSHPIALSNFQVASMAPFSLFQRGYIGAEECRLLLHRDSTRYAACLAPAAKQAVHALAMGMGEADPLKPDYSKLLASGQDDANKKGSLIIPLSHGHLENAQYVNHRSTIKAVIMIQAVIRSHRERRIAERLAKQATIQEAKELAMKEVKEKIIAEFRHREESTGMGKMKWDAKVRMKQSKLRTTEGNANISRNDTVIFMMQEALQEAFKEVEEKFKDIEVKELPETKASATATSSSSDRPEVIGSAGAGAGGVGGGALVAVTTTTTTAAAAAAASAAAKSQSLDVTALFGLFPNSRSLNLALFQSEDDDGSSLMQSSFTGSSIDYNPATTILVEASETTQRNLQLLLNGLDLLNPLSNSLVRGETLFESDFRRFLSKSSPTLVHLSNRLYKLGPYREPTPGALTFRTSMLSIIKVNDLLAELPSKQLFMQFVSAQSHAELSRELKMHFKITKNVDTVIEYFANILRTDLEFGLVGHQMRTLRSRVLLGLQRFAFAQSAKTISDFQEVINRSLSDNSNAIDEVFGSEFARLDVHANRFEKSIASICQELDKLRGKLTRLVLSSQEIDRKKRCLQFLQRSLMGSAGDVIGNGLGGDEFLVNSANGGNVANGKADGRLVASRPGTTGLIATSSTQTVAASTTTTGAMARRTEGQLDPSPSDQMNWVARIRTALKMQETSPASGEAKYLELKSVLQEFTETCLEDAAIIVRELRLPKHLKSIPISTLYPAHGRPGLAVGRGGDNYPVFEAHNIVYFVCLDYNGVFNGSDEACAKAGGFERKGAALFFQTTRSLDLPAVQVPLVATIDVLGFRVLATSRLPAMRHIFGDEGEIRKTVEEQVHGVLLPSLSGIGSVPEAGGNEVYINKNRSLIIGLKLLGETLNLASHSCKAKKDITHSTSYISADLKAFRGGENEFYLTNFWRTCPPESPYDTPHLPRAPRDQSIFWRQLRHEFTVQYSSQLSPDAFSLITANMDDADTHNQRVREATRFLMTDAVPKFTKALFQLDWSKSLAAEPINLEGLEVDLRREFHSAGINLRHLGLVRSLLWRRLPGKFSLFFHEPFVHTTVDQRPELQGEDIIRLVHLNYCVKSDQASGLAITSELVPISTIYTGPSITHQPAWGGAPCLLPLLSDEDQGAFERALRLSEMLRTFLLAEMVVRTLKNLLRLQLRQLARSISVRPTKLLATETVVTFLNVITNAAPHSHSFFEEVVVPACQERFGLCSIRPSDCPNLVQTLIPFIPYTVKRLAHTVGLQLSYACLSEFRRRPHKFLFSSSDVAESRPVLKLSHPLLSLAEAKLLWARAKEVEADNYFLQVLKDRPPGFYKLSERKGAREVINRGTLIHTPGGDHQIWGAISTGCETDHPGPFADDPLTRSIHFHPSKKPVVDCLFHASLVTQKLTDPFSVEIMLKCTGGSDTVRIAVMSGRFAIAVSRENVVTFLFVDGIHEVPIFMKPLELNTWTHVICTFDGTVVRCYQNDELCAAVEIEEQLILRIKAHEDSMARKWADLTKAEETEKQQLPGLVENEATLYFQSKEGYAAMLKEAQGIMTTAEFLANNIGADARDQHAAAKARKAEGLRLAKEQYLASALSRATQEVTAKYRQARADLADRASKSKEESVLRHQKGIRIGCSYESSSSTSGRAFFFGNLSCLSVYDTCLSSDRVHAHFHASRVNKARDSLRLYALAINHFQQAAIASPQDPVSLQGLAQALCDYLRVEAEGAVVARHYDLHSEGKAVTVTVIEDLVHKRNPRGIAEILVSLPQEAYYADLASLAIRRIVQLDPGFFKLGTNNRLTAKDLIHIPQVFGLDDPINPDEYIEAAALIFKIVTTDPRFGFVYGHMDLSWISQLRSPELVVSLVRQANENKAMSIFQVGELAAQQGRSPTRIQDEDVQALIRHMPLTQGFDFSRCASLTDVIFSSLEHLRNLRILNFADCSLLTDAGLAKIVPLAERLEFLSLANLSALTDAGVRPLAEASKSLGTLNLSGCFLLSQESILPFVARNKGLTTLQIARIPLEDKDVADLCLVLPANHSISMLDLAFCAHLSDNALMAIADNFLQLKVLNLTGVSRITARGASYLCSHCFALQSLNMEDLFLLEDRVFWFDPSAHGRVLVDELMLRGLTTLNLRDCLSLSDSCLEGLSERCNNLRSLNLRGCDKLTDAGLASLSLVYGGRPASLASSLTDLNLAYCGNLTAAGLSQLLGSCKHLQTLDLSGLVTVDDSFVAVLGHICPEIIRLTLVSCLALTDLALCALADTLWLERLDLTGCSRVTDEGLEVLTAVMSGIETLLLNRLTRVTDHSLRVLARNCKILRRLEVTQCPRLSSAAKAVFRQVRPRVQLVSDEVSGLATTTATTMTMTMTKTGLSRPETTASTPDSPPKPRSKGRARGSNQSD